MTNFRILTNAATGLSGSTLAIVSTALENIDFGIGLCGGIVGLCVGLISLYRILINKK